MNHYERLGVTPAATREQIRAAYRALARRAHPDLADKASAAAPSGPAMAELNQAWRVLGDPDRRRDYDRLIGLADRPAAGVAHDGVAATPVTTVAPLPPARVPWRLFLGLAFTGAFVVLVAHALTKPAAPAPVDNLLRPGDCVAVEPNQDAGEVPCDDAARWVVVRLVPFTSVCPTGTEAHRDRQGMGIACIRAR